MAVPAAQSVLGTPPMATNSRRVVAQSASFVVLEPMRMRSSACSPSRPVISASYCTCTFAALRIRSDRYCDIEVASVLSRLISDEHGHALRMLCQVHHGLAGGIAAADYIDILAAAKRRLADSRTIIEP